MLIHESVSHVLMEYSFSHFLGLRRTKEIIMIPKLADVLHELIHLKRIHFKERHSRNTLLDGSLEVLQRILGNELLLQDLVRILKKIYPRASSDHSVVIYSRQQVLQLYNGLIDDIDLGEDVSDLLRLLTQKMKFVLDLHFILLLEPELSVFQCRLHLLEGVCDLAHFLFFELFQILPARLEVAVQLRIFLVMIIDGLEEEVQVAFHLFGCVFVCKDEVVLGVVDDAFSTETNFIITAKVFDGLILVNLAVPVCCDIGVVNLCSHSKLVCPSLLFFQPDSIIG